MAVSKKLRFEVFKRDSFTCQYCGRSAPDVVLNCDHIEPVSKGGEDDILNLATSCFDCNSGKSNRELGDDAILAKRKAQLDELQERREQIEMMVEWQKGLLGLNDVQAGGLAELWKELVPPYSLTETGMADLKRYARKFDFQLLCRAMKAAVNQYIKYDDENCPISESANRAFRMMPKIAVIMRSEETGEAPHLRECLYIRGIVRNRMDHCDEQEVIRLLTDAARGGVSISALKSWALEARWYAEWRDEMERMIG